MADETLPTKQEAAKPLTKEEAVKAYYDAKDKAAKAAVVAQNPALKGVFCEANHS